MTAAGLNVPIITVLDDAGNILEMDQRRLVRYVIQAGQGARSVFLSGTTGEFDRLTNPQRQRIIEIGCEEIRAVNARLPAGRPAGAWAGVTAPTKSETLENLELAVHIQADMAVIAPLAIEDLALTDVAQFFQRDVAARLGRDPSVAIGLYDNPDIAARSAAARNIPVALVETLSDLPFITGLKSSASREVLQNYLRVFAKKPSPNEFDLYVGNAALIFELSDMLREAGADATMSAVAGVVAGPANLLPCEWQAAWQAVINRDETLLGSYKKAFARFDRMCVFDDGDGRRVKSIAAIKHALCSRGIISSPCVGRGTPALSAGQAERFTEELGAFWGELERSAWCTSCSVLSRDVGREREAGAPEK